MFYDEEPCRFLLDAHWDRTKILEHQMEVFKPVFAAENFEVMKSLSTIGLKPDYGWMLQMLRMREHPLVPAVWSRTTAMAVYDLLKHAQGIEGEPLKLPAAQIVTWHGLRSLLGDGGPTRPMYVTGNKAVRQLANYISVNEIATGWRLVGLIEQARIGLGLISADAGLRKKSEERTRSALCWSFMLGMGVHVPDMVDA